MKLNFEKTRDLNDKKIQLKCSEVQRRIEVSEVDMLIVALAIAHISASADRS